MSSTTFRRTSVRAAALGAVALLALAGCSADGDQKSSNQTTAAASSPSAESTASGSSSSESAAQSVSFAPGDCLTANPGISNVASFKKVDCAEEHTAEYLWAVPEADPSEEDGPDTEGACRAQVAGYQDKVEVALTATELRNASDQSQHCIMYTVTDPWTGQTIDADITLDDALAKM